MYFTKLQVQERPTNIKVLGRAEENLPFRKIPLTLGNLFFYGNALGSSLSSQQTSRPLKVVSRFLGLFWKAKLG